MERPLRFGVITIQNVPWPTLVERWQYLDELGFDSAWVADHFTNYREQAEPWLECWTLLSALAAWGPKTLRVAAEFADSWNFAPVKQELTPQQNLQETARRNKKHDDYSSELGRDPTEITRSLLLFPRASDAPFDSGDAFKDFVGRHREIGIDEFILYWWREDALEYGYEPANREMLEHLATQVIPKLRDSLITEIRAAAYGPPGAPKADRGYKADHAQGRVGVQVRDAERHVAGRVDRVEDRVEERHHLEHAGQHPDGVEHAPEERERLDDHARDKRDVLYPGREGADHRAEGGERERREKPDHHKHQGVFDVHADERHPDDEDPCSHNHPAQHTAQRVGERDLQIAHRAD